MTQFGRENIQEKSMLRRVHARTSAHVHHTSFQVLSFPLVRLFFLPSLPELLVLKTMSCVFVDASVSFFFSYYFHYFLCMCVFFFHFTVDADTR